MTGDTTATVNSISSMIATSIVHNFFRKIAAFNIFLLSFS